MCVQLFLMFLVEGHDLVAWTDGQGGLKKTWLARVCCVSGWLFTLIYILSGVLEPWSCCDMACVPLYGQRWRMFIGFAISKKSNQCSIEWAMLYCVTNSSCAALCLGHFLRCFALCKFRGNLFVSYFAICAGHLLRMGVCMAAQGYLAGLWANRV